ncbi:MAG: hypothetical protein QOE05_820, partial [Actinomycetota bacterium]|nr:hypothetical protein [Actinomycetota bacterium]
MLRRLAVLATVAAVLSPTAALAAPTCPDPVTRPLCGGRVVPEAELSVSEHQYSGSLDNLAETLKALQGVAPKGFFTPFVLGKSAGGHDLWVAKVTDPSVPSSQKKQVAISLSIHGIEPAGREGGIRYLEDLAHWASTEPGHVLYAGDTGVPIRDVLRQAELYVGFLNPDGWNQMDLDDENASTGATQPRYNDAGADLNRDFPTLGWIDHNASGGTNRIKGGTSKRGAYLDQPESRAWYSFLTSLPTLTTASDIHGELQSVNQSFSDIMWPAGQWSPDHQAKELQLGKDMIRTVERKFAEAGVTLGDVFKELPGAAHMSPANVATGYDVVGYDDSGFMGDSMQQLRGGKVVEIDIENFLSHVAPNAIWASPVEKVHIAAVRGNIEAALVTALKTDKVTASLDLGRVAYVDDPARTKSSDGTGGSELLPGEVQKPYDVTRLTYFHDLARDAGTTIPGLAAADIAAGADLSSYDSIVLSDVEVPKDTKGRPVNRAAFVKALRDFADRGGQLVLTDAAVDLLDDLGVVAEQDLTLQRTNAGHVDFVEGDSPLKKGLFGAPSQTYYEVPLGFPSTNAAPHYGVTRTVWDGKGGTTVGTVGDSTVLGEMPLGKGRLLAFGAVLPQP